ncbi:MAG: DEAD/DEAH box helicase [Deltaproteobacteria bacterium]|nr:DEAD/DEAH box helicase [Deltaproteobacteria bacterium]
MSNPASETVLEAFHPAVRTWFERKFPDGPTEPQIAGWPAIAQNVDTLIAAPTGSGKTLSAFLVCIDRLYKKVEAFRLGDSTEEGTQVVYISPLKALGVDIKKNLDEPIAEIAVIAKELGCAIPDIRVAVRSGDTPASQRAAMLRRPPQLLITTPESLYLLITAERSREILRGVHTVIVDEIHAVARDKRGSHLALSLERLEALCDVRPTRIGLSATQRPIETVSRLLVGAGEDRTTEAGSPICRVVDCGHQRELDLAIELPQGDLEAVASAEQMGEVLDRIADLVNQHTTTLVFVNTRRLAERLAHLLVDRLPLDSVAAHHGSLSKDRRLRVETRLRAGDLKVLVATASLELGIDIGPVDLVCQIGSPRALATFLQRVGRSGHSRGGTPKGRLYPQTRDELVECAGLLRGIRAGHLDAILPPIAPLDILAQQIVAACSAEEWSEDALYEMIIKASPFAGVTREQFDELIAMLSDGVVTARGRRGAYLHRDRVAGRLKGRRGARLAALTSGGAIPDRADYRVIMDPDETFIGSVDEDWAIESMAGDIFLLGSTSWRIRRVESGVVRVTDAEGAPPTIPFWFGEAPARSEELSDEVSNLRRDFSAWLERGDPEGGRKWLSEECSIGESAADQIARYLGVGRTNLGVLPTRERLVIERFFDETGGMQLVVHSPLGGRINRALGLALRKKFCLNFDFELQAAASDDAIVLSLGPQHSFPLESVPSFLHPDTVEAALSQAVLVSPMFTARWRWNLNRALLVLRFQGGRRNPPPIQRMQADDFMAALFPSLAACADNMDAGPVEIPDHPIVRQTLYDCLHEAMDLDGVIQLVKGFRSGKVKVHCVDTTEPSVLSHEILNSRPYTFLDDAPLEERRTRAVKMRRGLPVEARELAALSPEALAQVREEARPDPRDPDEVHDWLLSLGIVRPEPEWRAHFDLLTRRGRAYSILFEEREFWCAAERRRAAEAIFADARFLPDQPLPEAMAVEDPGTQDVIIREIVRGHLDCTGPIDVAEMSRRTGLSALDVEIAFATLETEGFALRGEFDEGRGEQFCARRLLVRIHLGTQERLRREIEPVSAQDFMRFLLRWQRATPDTRREGRRGVLSVIEQLQGFELAAGAWEDSIFPARVKGYRSSWLDGHCMSGEAAWGRLTPKLMDDDKKPTRGGSTPSKATPISFLLRADLPWLLAATRGDVRPSEPGPGAASEVLEVLRSRGALFHSELGATTDRLPIEIEEGLWDLVSRGLVSADGFQAVRSLLGSRDRWARNSTRRRAQRGLRRGARGSASAEGRWSIFPGPPIAGQNADAADEPVACGPDPDELAEAIAEQLLVRYGVVFRDLVARETLAVPWREISWAFRRMEARGSIRGGRFVSGFVGEQYALPGAVDALRRTRKLERNGEVVRISACDPLNLVGIITPGPRVPAVRGGEVLYRDGLPVTSEQTPAVAGDVQGSLLY